MIYLGKDKALHKALNLIIQTKRSTKGPISRLVQYDSVSIYVLAERVVLNVD
jgi:hypothetical protein